MLTVARVAIDRRGTVCPRLHPPRAICALDARMTTPHDNDGSSARHVHDAVRSRAHASERATRRRRVAGVTPRTDVPSYTIHATHRTHGSYIVPIVPEQTIPRAWITRRGSRARGRSARSPAAETSVVVIRRAKSIPDTTRSDPIERSIDDRPRPWTSRALDLGPGRLARAASRVGRDSATTGDDDDDDVHAEVRRDEETRVRSRVVRRARGRAAMWRRRVERDGRGRDGCARDRSIDRCARGKAIVADDDRARWTRDAPDAVEARSRVRLSLERGLTEVSIRSSAAGERSRARGRRAGR